MLCLASLPPHTRTRNTMHKKETVSRESQGVRPTPYITLDPRQERFIELYFNVDSVTFGNCYQSAKQAGYSIETARNLTHNRPKWLSEKLGQMQPMEPELLLLKLTSIINEPSEATQNKLRAIEMIMKHHQRFSASPLAQVKINIQDVLD